VALSIALSLTVVIDPADAQSVTRDVNQNLVFSSDDLSIPSYVPESENDADLGIQLPLRPAAEYDPFTFYGQTGWYFTDNAQVAGQGGESDQILHVDLTLSYVPILTGNLFGEITVREDTYRYGSDSDLDFDSTDAGAGLIYVIRPLGDTSVFVRYNYSSYFGPHDDWKTVYENHSVQAGLYKPWILSRNHFLYASFISDVSVDANPGFAQRDDYNLTVGYRHTPMRKVKFEAYARYGFLSYHERDRADWNYVGGMSLSYNLTRHFSVTSSVTYTYNESNLAGGDYEVWMPGIQIGGIYKF